MHILAAVQYIRSWIKHNFFGNGRSLVWIGSKGWRSKAKANVKQQLVLLQTRVLNPPIQGSLQPPFIYNCQLLYQRQIPPALKEIWCICFYRSILPWLPHLHMDWWFYRDSLSCISKLACSVLGIRRSSTLYHHINICKFHYACPRAIDSNGYITH